ncbi:MAG: hypothetical protein D6760_03665 [Deltaproteobacteria bacterium]|nr:MAG: hypothetical protein D6760_03665 [Deltaproteobacteria bacterium]
MILRIALHGSPERFKQRANGLAIAVARPAPSTRAGDFVWPELADTRYGEAEQASACNGFLCRQSCNALGDKPPNIPGRLGAKPGCKQCEVVLAGQVDGDPGIGRPQKVAASRGRDLPPALETEDGGTFA